MSLVTSSQKIIILGIIVFSVTGFGIVSPGTLSWGSKHFQFQNEETPLKFGEDSVFTLHTWSFSSLCVCVCVCVCVYLLCLSFTANVLNFYSWKTWEISKRAVTAQNRCCLCHATKFQTYFVTVLSSVRCCRHFCLSQCLRMPVSLSADIFWHLDPL